MNSTEAILDELKVKISGSLERYSYSPIKQETLTVVKPDIQSLLNRYGYTEDDIEVIVDDASEVDSNIIKIQLIPKSPKGRALLTDISNQS